MATETEMDVGLAIAPLSAPPKGLPFEPRGYSEEEITAGGFQTGVLFHARRGESDEMIRRLREKNEDLEQVDEGDMTALMWAAFHQSAEMIEALVRAGANPDHCNAAQDSAVHILAYIAHSEAYADDDNVLKCLTILERAGANMTILGPRGVTPQRWALPDTRCGSYLMQLAGEDEERDHRR